MIEHARKVQREYPWRKRAVPEPPREGVSMNGEWKYMDFLKVRVGRQACILLAGHTGRRRARAAHGTTPYHAALGGGAAPVGGPGAKGDRHGP